MPFRQYYCEDCETAFEHQCNFSDDIIYICPDCSSKKFYQDLTGVHVAVKRYNTVGAVGEVNYKLDKNKKQEEEGRRKEQERKEFYEKKSLMESAVPGTTLYYKDDVPEPECGSMPASKKKEIFKDKTGEDRAKAIDKYINTGE